jgi:SAM-dependent methyltransferase
MNAKRSHVDKIILICLFFLLSPGLWSTAGQQKKRPEVPYVPTPEKVVAEMLRLAEVNKDDVLYDLGCGDGRIVITAASQLGCRGVGIDIDPQRIKESRENAAQAGVEDRVEFLEMDLFEAEISPATVVTLYLLSEVNLRLRPKLLRELKPGTRVVSHDFDMDSWEFDKTSFVEHRFDDYIPVVDTPIVDNYWDKHHLFLWIIPANVTGEWNWTLPTISGKKKYKLKLSQEFQEVTGRAFRDASQIPLDIKDGKIVGDRLQFTLESRIDGRKAKLLFEGFADGHIMEGSVRVEGEPDVLEKWRASRVPSTYKPIDK